MAKEGIGPDGEQDYDVPVDEWAVATVRADPARTVTDHDMYDAGLLTDVEHDPCRWCGHRNGHRISIARPAGQWVDCTALCRCGWVDPAAQVPWEESLAHADRHIADALAARRAAP